MKVGFISHFVLPLTLALFFALLQAADGAVDPAGQPPQAPPAKPVGAPVIFADETLFTLYDNLGPFTPQVRAQAVAERLVVLAKDPFTRIYPVAATDRESTSKLVYGEMVVMTVTDRDAEPTGIIRQELAKDYAQRIKTALGACPSNAPFWTGQPVRVVVPMPHG